MLKIQNRKFFRIRPAPILAGRLKLAASTFSRNYLTAAGGCKTLILILTGMCFGHFFNLNFEFVSDFGPPWRNIMASDCGSDFIGINTAKNQS